MTSKKKFSPFRFYLAVFILFNTLVSQQVKCQNIAVQSGSTCVGQAVYQLQMSGICATTWSITAPAGSFTPGTQTTNSFNVIWNTAVTGAIVKASYTLQPSCTGSTPVTLTVNIGSPPAATPPSTPVGPLTQCQGTATSQFTGGGNSWSIANAGTSTINSSGTVTWDLNFSGTAVVSSRFSNSCGSSASSSVSVVVTPTKTFTVDIHGPADQSCFSLNSVGVQAIINGGSSNANVGLPTLSYTWYLDGSIISGPGPGSNGNNFASSIGASANVGSKFKCVVSSDGSGCTARSVPSLPFTVPTPGTPVNVSVTIGVDKTNCCVGDIVTFSTSSSSSTYIWKNNGVLISGASTTSGSMTLQVNTNHATGTFTSGDIITVDVDSPAGGCITGSAQGTTQGQYPTVYPSPLAPALPTSSNGCYAHTLSKNGTPPANVNWYWQGLTHNGTDYTSGAATGLTYTTSNTNGPATYYIRSKSTLAQQCWGAETAIPVVIDNPPPPISNSFAYCEWDQMNLTTTGIANTLNWYNTSNQLVATTKQYTPTGLLAGNYAYTVKNVSNSGCEGSSSSTISLTVRTNCDDNLNWNEAIAYGFDDSLNVQVEVRHSKSYSDGMGNLLQSQIMNYTNGMVLASQPVKNSFNVPVITTLAAPINSNSFVYRNRFITNAGKQPYSATDFDQRTTAGLNTPGEIKNPNVVGNTDVGTLGWYYSNNNTLEPFTPITGYPYSRSYTPEGPNPLTSTSAGAGDAYKMGNGHEVTSQKQTFLKSELSHYFSLRGFFVNTLLPSQTGPNLMSNNDGSTTTGFAPYFTNTLSIITQNGETYVKDLTPVSGQTFSGVFPIGVGGTYPAIPNTRYTFRVKGYNASLSGAPVSIIIRNATDNTNIKFPATSLNSFDSWIEYTFTTPPNCTSLKVGLICQNPQANDVFYINELGLFQELNIDNTVYGYKIFTTDPDGKKMVSFTDFDGHALVSATVNALGTYDNYSYVYYNDIGQMVAEVAPMGVDVNAGGVLPKYTTLYKYDYLGRLIETTSPDEGTSQFIYSTDGKIRFSQNQIQRDASPKRFSYTNYDYLARLIESGEYTSSGTNPYVFEPSTTAVPATYSVLSIVDKVVPPGKNIETMKVIDYPALSQKFYIAQCTDYTFIKYDTIASDFPAGDTDHPQQHNLIGNISKTQNANATTWYSYDDFGQLEWSKQSIAGLGSKTVDYTYDFSGNVKQVIYQKNQTTDKFYHFYNYDSDQRLQKVRTSLDGTAKKTQAVYSYYLHGPLKRVELTQPRQGIDYVYTITGALKGINSSAPSYDPSQDGISGAKVSFNKDAFGENLYYYDNDYSSRSYSGNAVTLNSSAYPNQYGGMLRATSYNNVTDLATKSNANARHIYGYTYDGLNQLTNAQWGNLKGDTLTFVENQREQIPAYDKNGNIQSLVRNGKQAQTTANYSYVYEGVNGVVNTNRLDKINNNGSLLVDYTYNSIGQMIKQVEGSKTMNVSYNAYGLVKEVRDVNNQLMLSYLYDDRGDLVEKIAYAAGIASKNTWYVRDPGSTIMGIYEQTLPGGQIQQTEIPIYGEGRIATYKPLSSTYFYEVTDHLGNVRALIGNPSPSVYPATLETNTQSYEQGAFGDYSHINFDLFDHTDAGTTYTYAQLLNGGPNSRVGLSKSLDVSPGDKIKVEVYAKYQNAGGSNVDINSFVLALTGAFGVTSASTGEAALKYAALNNYALKVKSGTAHTSSGSVGGWATILLFDKNYNFVDASFWGVTDGHQPEGSTIKAAHQYINWEMTVGQPGHAFVFLSNESLTQVDVYFDDLTITHTQSPYVAGSDFYPFGLTMDGEEITDEPYRYGYQGQFSEKNPTTSQNEFELRMYDARFGRWLSPDPYGQYASPYVGMGNMPNMGTDPDGGLFGPGLEEFLAAGGKLLPEVTVSATRLSSLVIGGMVLDGLSAGKIGLAMDKSAGGGSWNTSGANIPHMDENQYRRMNSNIPTETGMVTPNTSELTSSLSLPSAETIQNIAGYAGMIPILNTPAAIIEASAALVAGDYWGAGFAVLGAIPVAGVLVKGAKLGIIGLKRLQVARRAGMEAHDAFYGIMKARGWAANKGLRGLNGRLQIPDALAPGNRFWLELKPNTWSGRLAGKIKAARYKKQLGIHGRVVYYNPTTGIFVPF